MNVNIPSNLSLSLLLDRTKQLMMGKFLTYSAYDDNCGDMILAILQSNNLYNFTKYVIHETSYVGIVFQNTFFFMATCNNMF
jgi:hypothetical protein